MNRQESFIDDQNHSMGEEIHDPENIDIDLSHISGANYNKGPVVPQQTMSLNTMGTGMMVPSGS